MNTRKHTHPRYVDGDLVGSIESKSVATLGLNHGDHEHFGVGSRPTNAGSGGGFTGATDELVIYNRALTASEAVRMAERTTAITPFPGVSYASTLIHTDVLEWWDVTLM